MALVNHGKSLRAARSNSPQFRRLGLGRPLTVRFDAGAQT
jgi:hypothetical protein